MSNARAEASRKNGANSRGPKTAQGKARSSLNALKHGMRAAKHVVLPDEDAVAFNELQTALFEELAPPGGAPAGARAADCGRRLAPRPRRPHGGRGARVPRRRGRQRRARPDPGRQRHARGRDADALPQRAMGELTRALRTLKALQAEQAANARQVPASRPAAPVVPRREPNEPTSAAAVRLDYVMPDPPIPGPTLHDAAASWLPHQPETDPRRMAGAIARAPNEPEAAELRRAHIA